MEKVEPVFCKLTVLFREPFWVGVYERRQGDRLEVCKITFGGEPRDGEVLAYLLEHWRRLSFSPAVEELPRETPKNPKRARREARKQLEGQGGGIGTKAQQAIRLQREQSKAERTARAKARREEEQQRRFLLRQQRRKEKHRTG